MKGSQVSFLFLQRKLSENHSAMKNQYYAWDAQAHQIITFFTAPKHLPTLLSTQRCFVLGRSTKAQGDVGCAGSLCSARAGKGSQKF